MQNTLFSLSFIATTALATVAAQAELIVSLQPASPTVQAGQIAELQLFLTGNRTSVITSVELEMTAMTGSASFTTVAPTLDAFGESAVTSSGGALNVTNDGSLLNDLFLGYVAGVSSTGIAVGSDQILLGTLWVQTPAGIVADYVVGFEFVELLDDSAIPASLANTPTGATIHSVVPEPALMAVAGLSAITVLRRKRHG